MTHAGAGSLPSEAATAATAGSPASSATVATCSFTAEEMRQAVAAAVESVLGEAVDEDAPLMAAGLDSLGATEVHRGLQAATGLPLPATLIFDYPTTSALTEYLLQLAAATASGGAVVVAGRAGRGLVGAGRRGGGGSVRVAVGGVGGVGPEWRLQR